MANYFYYQADGGVYGPVSEEGLIETGKAGKLVLEISIGPASKNGGHQMLVSDRVVVKAPTPKRSESFSFFVFDDVIKAVEDDTSCTVLAGSPIGAS